jgi:vacuolar-type H+-ATPase subunit E/Vma4
MEGIEKIKGKIIADANTEIRSINREIEAQIDDVKRDNSSIIDDIKKDRQKEKEREIKLLQDKTLAQARLKVKRKYLETREALINSYIENGAKAALKDEGYKTFIEDILKNDKDLLGEGITIYCNANDKDIVKRAAGKVNMKADVKETDIDGGVILEDKEGKRINESMVSVLERKRDELRQKVIEILG